MFKIFSASKYKNRKTEYNGALYDSKKEADYALQLDMLMKAGEIQSWERQIRLDAVVEGKKVCTYIADFKVTEKDGRIQYVDVKGFKPAVYRLKKKLIEALYHLTINEV